MSFETPQALLIALPLALLVYRLGGLRGPAGWLRWAMVPVVTLALARPVLQQGGDEIDVVVVVDRSRSMPAGSDGSADEIIRLVESKRTPGRRVGVVTFGREARIERAPAGQGTLGSFQRPVDADASDLSSALQAADDLLAPGRAGRVLVLSDGRATGGDVRAAARRLALRGVPVDYRVLERPETELDVAVKEVSAPASLGAKEPFHLSVVVSASKPATVGYQLLRSGTPIAKGTATLKRGDNRLLFRDRIDEPQLADYRFELLDARDAVPENDRGRAVVRVQGPPRVMLMRTDGKAGALAQALTDSGILVDVVRPSFATLDQLEGYSAVVIEDVPAQQLGDAAMRVLNLYVKERGGGLVVTGGESSFGQGGYHRSELDELLPVSMELRQEQRKSTLCMVVAMDRSGSMSATTPDGRTKMALAAEGTVAALQLLSPGDEAGVWVVDEKAHRILGLTPVEKGLPYGDIASLQSQGGGIFIYEALEATALEIDQSTKQTRHIVLFADAADSEQPGDYQNLLADLAKKKITVSVIGMGKPTDSDAALLIDVARRGNGRIYFAEDVTSLPRVFAEETIAVARSAFIDEPTRLTLSGDLALLGPAEPALSSPPRVGGYNLTYLRPGAGVAYRSDDDNKAPLLALWERGLGHVATFTAAADGKRASELVAWKGYRALAAKIVRWSMAPPDSADAVVRVRREGHQLKVTVEVDPVKGAGAGAATVSLLPGDGSSAKVQEAPLKLEDEGRLSATFSLGASGTFHPVVKIGGQVVKGPPATLPYAPEFEPQPAGKGRETLAAIAALTGGVERLGLDGVFDRGREAPGKLPLAPALVALALAMMVTEVGLRRFFFRTRRAAVQGAAGTSAEIAKPPEPATPVVEPTVTSAIDEARARAKKRLDR